MQMRMPAIFCETRWRPGFDTLAFWFGRKGGGGTPIQFVRQLRFDDSTPLKGSPYHVAIAPAEEHLDWVSVEGTGCLSASCYLGRGSPSNPG